ncbi:MAG: hypothetical protein UF228_03270 [Lachnospiraceae bacterium]|nr:hypothetical protein [Lachnospiraceae bacterium]
MDSTIKAAIITAIFTLFISLASGILTIIKMYLDYKNNKKERASQAEITKAIQDAEDKRTKIQIDANVVWSARVEWIQNVRNITVELLSAVNNYIQSVDIESQKINLEAIHKNSNLLILYFGPDKKQNINIDILDTTTNESKNEKIVQLIKNIDDDSTTYFMKQNWITVHHNSVLHCQACKNSNEIYETCDIIDYANINNEELIRRCKEHMDFNLQMEHKYIVETEQLRTNITKLTEAMRIYLKIEWDRAKKRSSI